MSLIELDVRHRQENGTALARTGVRLRELRQEPSIKSIDLTVFGTRADRPIESLISVNEVSIPVAVAEAAREAIDAREQDLQAWGIIYPAIINALKEGNGMLDSLVKNDPLLNFIRQRWGSSPVLELVYSKGEILQVPKDTAYGQAVAELFAVEGEESIAGYRSPYEGILRGLEITEGVRERLNMFEEQAEHMILFHMLHRLQTGNRDGIKGVDFGSGSMRYISTAMHKIFQKYPYLRDIFGEGLASVSEEVYQIYPELRKAFEENNTKIPLRFYGIDSDPAANKYCVALANELGVQEFVFPVLAEFRNLLQPNGLFTGQFHPDLVEDTVFDMIFSSGLDDYYKISRRAQWFSRLYSRLKPGIGSSYIASIADFPSLQDTDGSPINKDEPQLLTDFFNWGKMYGDDPVSAIDQYQSAGWNPREIKYVEWSPNRRFFAVVTQRG